MRRPSRQGLSQVCPFAGNTFIRAAYRKFANGRPFCLPPSQLFHSVTRVLLAGQLILLTCGLPAQTPGAAAEDHFSRIRNGMSIRFPDSLLQAQQGQVLDAASRFLNDSSTDVRMESVELVGRAAMAVEDDKLRRHAVELLLTSLEDSSAEVAGAALQFLTACARPLYPPTAASQLQALIHRRGPHLPGIIRLCGYLQLRDLIPEIYPYTQPGHPAALRWASLLTLARLGDIKAVSDVLNRVSRLEVNDDVVYSIFPDLVYTRHPQTIAYMVRALQSREKRCLTADLEKETSIPCGYRIMEQLAPIIDGFPVALDDGGDLKSRDYATALDSVRQWFVEHPTYRILDTTY